MSNARLVRLELCVEVPQSVVEILERMAVRDGGTINEAAGGALEAICELIHDGTVDRAFSRRRN